MNKNKTQILDTRKHHTQLIKTSNKGKGLRNDENEMHQKVKYTRTRNNGKFIHPKLLFISSHLLHDVILCQSRREGRHCKQLLAPKLYQPTNQMMNEIMKICYIAFLYFFLSTLILLHLRLT